MDSNLLILSLSQEFLCLFEDYEGRGMRVGDWR